MAATRVVAICSACSDQHPLGDRPAIPGTTKCPRCGATSYRTDTARREGVKSDAQRIADAVTGVDGVGEQTRENIVAHFGSWHSFVTADKWELVTIPGVGEGNGQGIIEARPDPDSA